MKFWKYIHPPDDRFSKMSKSNAILKFLRDLGADNFTRKGFDYIPIIPNTPNNLRNIADKPT